MITQTSPQVIQSWFRTVVLYACLMSCDSGKFNATDNAKAGEADSLITETSGKVGKIFSHPYLSKADEIKDKEGWKIARPYYQAAISLFEKEKNWEGLIMARNRISSYYFRQGDNDSLFLNLENTLALGKKHLDSNSLAMSETQHWLGLYFERINDPYAAIPFQQKALNTRIKRLGNNHLLVAQSMKALGDTYLYRLSDYNNAESYYEGSVDIKSRLLDTADVELVRGYYAVASAKRLNDDTEGAINYGLKALKTALMHPVENRQRIGLCHNILANTYNDKNDYENATYHYQKAIEISKANFGQDNSYLTEYYNGIGSIYLQQKQFELAKSYFIQGLNINKLHFTEDSDQIAKNFMSLGLVYTQLKKYDSALVCFDKSLAIRLKVFGAKDDRTAIIYEYMGDMYAENNDLHTGLQHYQNALISLVDDFDESNVLVNPEFSTQIHGFSFIHVIIKKALLLKRRYHNSKDVKFLEAALETYLLASKIIDLKRNNSITEESRLVLIENYFQDQMENGIDCAYLLARLTGEMRFQNIAFQLIEKSKYMLLFESLMKNENKRQFGIPDSLSALEKDLKVEMAYFKQSINELRQRENPDQRRLDKLQNQVFATALNQERLYEKLKAAYPNYYDLKFDSITLSIEDVQKALKHSKTKIIELYDGKNDIYVVSISDEAVHFKRIQKSMELEGAITTYLNQISNSLDITDPANYKLFCQSAFQLHELLIKPILETDRFNKNLVIIPHGKLSVLPFESIIQSLPDYQKVDYKNLDYLIRDYQFNYAYSVNLLLKNKIKTQGKSQPKLLAFSYSSESNSQKKKNEIIGSSKEINNIARFVNGTYYKGNQATESAFKSIASQFDILHLAVHGIANNESMLSNSLLFKNEMDSANDGILHSYELLNLNINAKLVVLSACETGLGKQFKGEGIFSMARSFAYAGCQSIIMSYWKANDNATAQVMGSFYNFLVEGATVDKALRHAKISYIDKSEELTAHPSAWAAFVPLGDMTTPIFKNENISARTIWLFSLACLLILAITYLVRRQKARNHA
ncbi:CHAT domain-containing protein [Fulvivirgaceae bacterium BMA12]|uniref:CHAT domain-containing protein n=1 Tax=Agaribacillus aureus TaxID=3051825 RepID=A0ABT8LEJ6_9BACT|nr:CHAT domain-containing protein [Fulvivirgaceae bacterium BMA12]